MWISLRAPLNLNWIHKVLGESKIQLLFSYEKFWNFSTQKLSLKKVTIVNFYHHAICMMGTGISRCHLQDGVKIWTFRKWSVVTESHSVKKHQIGIKPNTD